MRTWPACLAAALLSTIAISAGAQRRADVSCARGDTEVRSLKFVGNHVHSDFVLERGIASTPSTWWRRTLRVIGKRYCFDSLAFAVEDSARLDFYYRRTGYPDVQVRPVLTRLNPRTVALEYHITEGEPMVVDSMTVAWFDSVPDAASFTSRLPLSSGDRFDIAQIEATRDTLDRRLKERGYPDAEVLRDYSQDVSAHRAQVTFNVYPRSKAWIGKINIPEPLPAVPGREPRIDTSRVRDVLGIREGQLYNVAALEAVKRGLFLTEAFRYVEVEPDTLSFEDGDSLVTINLSLVESELLATRASIGWGNLDCVRAGVNHTNYNFLGGLRRLDIALRASKIGYAKPLDLARGNLCTSDLRGDRFSDTLNYYAAVTLSQSALFGARIVPSLSLYSERRSEYKAFLRETPFGLIGSVQQGMGSRLPMTWSYQLEFGRTVAEPAFFCAVFNVCETEARQRLQRGTRSAVVGWAATRSSVTSLVSPTSGSVIRADFRHASPAVGAARDASFNRATIDGAWYWPVMSGALVARFRAGAVLGSKLNLSGAPRFIPLQERLYAGGANSVRGFRQNELGPAIYLPTGVDTLPIAGNDTLVYLSANPNSVGERTVPTGGDNVVVANLELRLRSFAFPELMQVAVFVDAGQVWNRGRAGTGVNFSEIRVTPGIGVRIFSPVGPLRVDVGYNPYRRPAGPAYVTPSLDVGGLICVSPGNTLRVRKAEPGIPARQVDEGDCPASYAPRRGESFWNRLTFQFSIGQPF